MTNPENCKQLIFGLVAPTGTNLKKFISCMTRSFAQFNIDPTSIKLSDYIGKKIPIASSINSVDLLNQKMTNGTQLRKQERDAALLARYAISQVSSNRAGFESRQAFVINQLKRPEEIALLREVYGPLFFLIGINETRSNQISHLTQDDHSLREDAKRLINRDQEELIGENFSEADVKEFGQQTRNTFQMADIFFDGSMDDKKIIGDFTRFLEVIHSAPNCTPTSAEHFMFMAQSSALRSGDLSRQVGAVIVTSDGELAGTGANEVPKAGGGQYWSDGEFDGRDHWLGFDANKKQIDSIAETTWESLKGLFTDEKLKDQVISQLKKSPIAGITEYGRPVHAEMSAILACTRLGISTRQSKIYCTTYPCHNCAKHIVAAGIKEVFYIEPYPKSFAIKLHRDSLIDVVMDDETEKKMILDSKEISENELEIIHKNVLRFIPFVGIAPPRFLELFSINMGRGSLLKKKMSDGTLVAFDRISAIPRFEMQRKLLIELEDTAITSIKDSIAA